jgi:hypothetical protein
VRRPNASSLTRGRSYQTHPINSNPSVAGRPEVQVVGARAPRAYAGAADATLAAERAERARQPRRSSPAQAGTRSSPVPRPQPLRRLPRRTRSFRETWARCGASSWGLKANPRPTCVWTACVRASSRPCMRRASSAQLVHAGRRPPCVRLLAPCMHSRTLAPCEHAVCCELCVGCSAEAGSHSSRPHSSPTLIVQERQSVCHMANGTLQAFIGRNL